MSRRSALGRVRGLGSAKEGVAHWWAQRLTAIALIPLSVWFVATLVLMARADHAQITAWIAHPAVAILLILLLGAMFYHLKLGLQVVIEDYITGHGVKLACLLVNTYGNIFLGAVAAFAVLKIAFGSS